jgi:hypothetical protein
MLDTDNSEPLQESMTLKIQNNFGYWKFRTILGTENSGKALTFTFTSCCFRKGTENSELFFWTFLDNNEKTRVPKFLLQESIIPLSHSAEHFQATPIAGEHDTENSEPFWATLKIMSTLTFTSCCFRKGTETEPFRWTFLVNNENYKRVKIILLLPESMILKTEHFQVTLRSSKQECEKFTSFCCRKAFC